MAFRRKQFRRSFRRRVKWDMQEFRECERLINVDTGTELSCSNPLILADYVAGVGGTPAGSVLQSAGAGRGVIWGGCRGQVQYSVRLDFPTEFASVGNPCNMGFNVMTALVRLPILDDGVTPAYLPNLLQTKSQLSIVRPTQSDTVESVLWRRQEHLRWGQFAQDGSGCWPKVPGTTDIDGEAWIAAVAASIGLYGRTWGRGEFRARVKRRLSEREAIFLVTNISLGIPTGIDPGSVLQLQRLSWIQFALRRM